MKRWLRAMIVLVGLALPAGAAVPGGYEMLVVYPKQVVVLDPNATSDWGVIPLNGTVEAAAFLPERNLLVVHAPDTQLLAMVDLTPFSPDRYQVMASYRSPELARRGLRFVRSGMRVYLADARTAVAILDPATMVAKLGIYAFDFLPLVYQQGTQVLLPQGYFALKDGQLTYEDPRPRRTQVYAPEFIRLAARPRELLADTAQSKLYVSLAKTDGTGAIAVVDAATRTVERTIAVPWPLDSMVWLDNGEIGVLACAQNRLGVYDLKTQRWARVWSPPIKGQPKRLLAIGAPPVAPPPLQDGDEP